MISACIPTSTRGEVRCRSRATSFADHGGSLINYMDNVGLLRRMWELDIEMDRFISRAR